MTAVTEQQLSATGIEAVASRRRSELAQPICAQLAPVGELIASMPSATL